MDLNENKFIIYDEKSPFELYVPFAKANGILKIAREEFEKYIHKNSNSMITVYDYSAFLKKTQNID